MSAVATLDTVTAPSEASGFPALFTRIDSSIGSISISQRVHGSRDLHITEAAAVYAQWLAKAPHTVNRTWRIESRLATVRPTENLSGSAHFGKLLAASGGFMTGNVTSNVQFSNYIRAHSQTACNGREFAPGELRAFDLKAFHAKDHAPDGLVVPKRIRAAIEQRPNETMILYRVANVNTSGNPDVHGWVLAPAESDGVHAVVRKRDLVMYSHHGAAMSDRVMAQAVAVFGHAHVAGSAEVLLDLVKGEVVSAHPRVLQEGEALYRSLLMANAIDDDTPDPVRRDRQRG